MSAPSLDIKPPKTVRNGPKEVVCCLRLSDFSNYTGITFDGPSTNCGHADRPRPGLSLSMDSWVPSSCSPQSLAQCPPEFVGEQHLHMPFWEQHVTEMPSGLI